ncbi:MAG: glutamine-hydrolyzing carbamoyl-phosphate synthase small subunit [Alphaproteobacteria bacterium]|nr:glutamine-hydrolyzing carbamoyl-phosphate synthase small subunit [Alphaproteobacteria bacterium]
MLADGTVFSGFGVGAHGITAGEICFNTAMTGYQEILTDPSYTGQIITFTFPHIGNVGCNGEDIEAAKPYAAGLILRENITDPSSFRANVHLTDWLINNGITGICGVDTRALTAHIRKNGAQNCAIGFFKDGKIDQKKLQAALDAAPDMNGLELAAHVTTPAQYEWRKQRWALGKGYTEIGNGAHHVVAIDYGEKLNILRCLASQDCRLTVVPATTTAEEILALKPDGVFLSNGPGDPSATAQYSLPVIQKIIAANVPLFGICLGHQMLGLALGAKTEKMKQGHRGANHPVKDLKTNKVAITSQNHGFCVSDKGLPANVEVTHRSLFDGTIQGIATKDGMCFSVQGHPEASPGPHDWLPLFKQFAELMASQKKRAA